MSLRALPAPVGLDIPAPFIGLVRKRVTWLWTVAINVSTAHENERNLAERPIRTRNQSNRPPGDQSRLTADPSAEPVGHGAISWA